MICHNPKRINELPNEYRSVETIVDLCLVDPYRTRFLAMDYEYEWMFHLREHENFHFKDCTRNIELNSAILLTNDKRVTPNQE